MDEEWESDDDAGDSPSAPAFVWAGGLTTDGPRRRAWVSRDVARSTAADGGLSIPHLTHELQALSLRTVERWARSAGGVLAAIGQLLLGTSAHGSGRSGILVPSRHEISSTPTLLSTLAATGIQLRRALAATPRTQAEVDLAHTLLQHVGRGTSKDYGWENGWLVVDYGRVGTPLAELRQYQSERYGNLQVDALLRAKVVGDDILRTAQGHAVKCADFPGLFPASDRVEDVVNIAWTEAGALCFQSVRFVAPLAPAVTDHFRRFCDTLAFNYPGLLRPPAQQEDLILRPATLDVWRLRRTDRGLVVVWSPVEGVAVDLGTVSTTAEASTIARRTLDDHAVSFERHCWLDAPYALWTGVDPPTKTAAFELLSAHSCTRAAAEQDARRLRWRQCDTVIADALETVPWTDVLHAPGVPAAHRLLYHKIKGGRLSGWDRTTEQRGCPHCPAIGADGGTAFHTMWACSRAQARWSQLLRFWAPLTTTARTPHSDGVKRDIFGLKLTVLPDGLWRHHELTRLGVPTAEGTIATGLAVNAVWRRHVLLTLHLIWRWRTAPDTTADVWTEAQAQAQHGASLQAVQQTLRWERQPHSAATPHTAAALAVLFGIAEQPQRLLQPPETKDGASYLLYFDGGSRGNPGPGGSGAVVVEVDSSGTKAKIIWSAAVASNAASTTNNQAEYLGLLTGLKAAEEHLWTPLSVIGDSQRILRQMHEYRPPKNGPLQELYAPARRLADTLRVSTWQHHYRAHNKMADAAANIAMDEAVSSTAFHPTDRQGHSGLEDHLPTDFAKWQDSFFCM